MNHEVVFLGIPLFVITSLSYQDWSPHVSFILKGSQILALQLKGGFKSKISIQEYRNEIQNLYWTCAWIIWSMFPVQCEELRMNYLTLLLVVTIPYACWFLWRANYIENFKWHLHFQFGVAFWRVILREVFLKAQIALGVVTPLPPILGGWRLLKWHPLLQWRRVHSRRMETLTSSPPPVKNGEFSEEASPQVTCFSPRVMEAQTFLRYKLQVPGSISAKR